MVALPADIAAGTRAALIETWANPTIKARYLRARDGSEEPAEGFFDASADAESALVQRAGLLGTERRRFAVSASDLLWPVPGLAVPTFTLRDPSQGVDGLALACRIEINLELESTEIEVMV
ncbi:MAG: hypothetical protein EOP60_07170 [Sphingomonadales bacterium]|nr:MAG: hypothetical protein EOP60_07170 [Sphingomonadales bacterium]